jgi:hypothetical protein
VISFAHFTSKWVWLLCKNKSIHNTHINFFSRWLWCLSQVMLA